MSKLNAIIGSSLILSFASNVIAQDAGLHLNQDSDRLGMQAGLRLSIPFGTAGADRFDNRATVQLAISATRVRSGFGQDVQEVSSQDIFAIGFDESLQPRLSLSGQDISYAAFPSVYRANDTANGDGPNNNNKEIVVGALLLLAVGGVIVIGVKGSEPVRDLIDFAATADEPGL